MELKNIVLPDNFSGDNWIDYFEKASTFFSARHEKLNRYNDNDFSAVSRLGVFEFEDRSTCTVYLIMAKQSLSERSSKKKQFNKAKEIISEETTHSGLFIIYDDHKSFRLSFVYPVYKGVRSSLSNYKRNSFFVSNTSANKTYVLQMNDLTINSTDDLKTAFSVDKVSEMFYKEFEDQYAKLQTGVYKDIPEWVNDDLCKNFALLFVIRIIFLGFVQKKGWLGSGVTFIRDYIACFKPEIHRNGMYRDLMAPLFFTALNTSPSTKKSMLFPGLPEHLKQHMVTAPYLNGGLFREHDVYDKSGLYLSDSSITQFVDFIFSFNFTLDENTPYDEDLELNPEFLGIIFEKLVNKEHGAIYTPRLEVDLMCRLALVKYLQQSCKPPITTDALYPLFFPEYGSNDEQTNGNFSKEVAEEMLDKLETVTVCDPAIGSGAFAVGMLNVIDSIECSLRKNYLREDIRNSAYDRKKRIIYKSLYGLEVQDWAVWITQLRLWITLLIEADDILKESEIPLLPSFDFKIRQGDSLVQILGSNLFTFSGETLTTGLIKRRVNELMNLKQDYYSNNCSLDFPAILEKQKDLFADILAETKAELKKRLKRIENESKTEVQTNFLEDEYQTQIEITTKNREDEIRKLKFEINEIVEESSSLNKHNIPFIWRVDFPEVFVNKGGFDIVIGNPPYVSQEEIVDPQGKIKESKVYKDLLKSMAHQDFPQDIPESTVNGKSDLYTFFYIRGLRLLNKNGIHCFICSNSWLDVEFGAWLQKFILERCPLHFIIDNLGRRVFKHAAINTIISVIGAPQKIVRGDDMLRFVAFKLPFENSLYTENFLAIEETTNRKEYDDLRVNAIDRETLSKEGWQDSKENKYSGSKWGGIYIKAPSIYFAIMEKAKDKLVRLGDVAKVARGVTTGADEFFYIPKTNPHQIEQDFLKPVIKSPKECKSILINPDELGLWLFMCPHEKRELTGTNALKYIELGEKAEKYIKQGKDKGKTITGIHNVSTVKGRKHWYELGTRKQPQLITPSSFGDTFKVYINNGVFANKRLYEIYFDGVVSHLALALNSSLFYFFVELYSSTGLGDGLLDKTVAEIESTYIINPDLLKDYPDIEQRIESIQNREIMSIFDELQVDPDSGCFNNANPLPDRKALDEVVFKALGLTDSEVKALYAGLLELTANRLRKAKTFK